MKNSDRIFPSNGMPVFHEGLLPELALMVSPGFDELLVFRVRDLVTVDQKVADIDARGSLKG